MAEGFNTPEEVIEGWMHSPEHRRVITDRDFTETGIAEAAGYWEELLSQAAGCFRRDACTNFAGITNVCRENTVVFLAAQY